MKALQQFRIRIRQHTTGGGRGNFAGGACCSPSSRLHWRGLREIDWAGHWGGEKFCCVLPRTDGHEAVGGDDPERVLARAHVAVHAARSKGGNRAQRLDANAPEPCAASA